MNVNERSLKTDVQFCTKHRLNRQKAFVHLEISSYKSTQHIYLKFDESNQDDDISSQAKFKWDQNIGAPTFN